MCIGFGSVYYNVIAAAMESIALLPAILCKTAVRQAEYQ
jgi:hypothetical protein